VNCFFETQCSNFGPILHRFGDTARILTPPLFNPSFGGVSVEPDRPCWGQRAHGP